MYIIPNFNHSPVFVSHPANDQTPEHHIVGSLFIAEFIMDGLVGYRSNIYEARGSYISFLYTP